VSTPLLQLRGIAKSFGGLRAVDGVAIEVAANSVTGLIGANGAGKTTLFNVVCGALAADEGQAVFAGQDITGWPAPRIARAGMVRTFQTPTGFPHMTVLENMLVFAADREDGLLTGLLHGRGRKTREAAQLERAETILRTVGLWERRDEWVKELSAGELKLLEFSRPLMADPKILLLDEPAAGVNPNALHLVVDFITRLKAEGVTFLVIDHNLRFIRDICDFVYVMADGKVIFADEPEEVVKSEVVIRSYIGGTTTQGGSLDEDMQVAMP